MRIQNFTGIDANGNKRVFDFEGIISRHAQQFNDLGLCDYFQVLMDSPKRAVWRLNTQFDVNDGYIGTWWIIDLDHGIISEGNDCSDSRHTYSYKEKKINFNAILHEYRILDENN